MQLSDHLVIYVNLGINLGNRYVCHLERLILQPEGRRGYDLDFLVFPGKILRVIDNHRHDRDIPKKI